MIGRTLDVFGAKIHDDDMNAKLQDTFIEIEQTSFILGFDEEVEIPKHNFKQVDALPYAKEGTLQQKLDEIFGA